MSKKDVMSIMAIGALLASADLGPGEKRRLKQKVRKCRDSHQMKRRAKNRIANKSRAINFKRAK